MTLLLGAVWSGAMLGVAISRPQVWIVIAVVSVVLLLTSVGVAHRSDPLRRGARRGLVPAVAALVAAGATSAVGAAVRTDAVDRGLLATQADGRLAVVADVTAVSDVRVGGHGQRWMVGRLSTVRWAGVNATRSREHVVFRPPSDTELVYGASYRVRGVAYPLDGPSASYYRRLGAVVGLDPVSVVRTRSPPRWVQTTTRVRTAVAKAAHRRLSAGKASLLTGLVTGDLTGQPDQVAKDVRTSGLSHLVAVSGSNVAIVVAATMALALLTGCGRRVGWWVSLVTVWWFVVMVRADPSVIRAAVMASLVLAAMLIGRVRSAVHLLATAGTLVLLGDPLLAGRLGFVLSMSATAGVLLLTPTIGRVLKRHTVLPRGPRTVLAATCGAQLAVAPILLIGGNEIHPASLPANLVAVPAAAVVSMVGAVAAVVSVISVPTAAAMVWLTSPLLSLILGTAAVFASSTGRHLAEILATVIAAIVLRRTWPALPGPIRRAAAAVIVVAGVVIVGPPKFGPAAWPDRPLLTVLDVGQGDALLLGDPVGGWMLVDAGPDPHHVAATLDGMGITALSAVVATHADSDHVTGMAAVLKAMPVGVVLIGPLGDQATEVLQAASVSGVPVHTIAAGGDLRHGGMTIRVLSPPARGLGLERNDNSLVLRVDVDNGRSVLLPGDAEALAQTLMLDDDLIDVDVLMVPHHGGNTNAAGFLRSTTPEVAIISVGRENEFGHPHPDVLADLAGSTVRRTDVEGTIDITLSP